MIRVTLCRDARSCVRCVKGYSVRVLTGTDARPCVPTNRYTSCRSTTDARPCVPTNRYSSCGTTTDARPCVPTNRYTSWHPYQSLHVMSFDNGRTDGLRPIVRPYKIVTRHVVRQRTHRRSASDRASLQRVTRHSVHISRYSSRHPYRSLHVIMASCYSTRRYPSVLHCFRCISQCCFPLYDS